MTKDRPRNMAASVRQRLMNKAREGKEDFNFVLTRYDLERLLYRLSQSPHRDRFVLKGAMLLQIWSGRFTVSPAISTYWAKERLRHWRSSSFSVRSANRTLRTMVWSSRPRRSTRSR
jgi:hypothetical protein